ncbi:hypothetical protein DSD19_12035 [Rhodovulum sp. BSW8]|uniref:hypothetical protein n=1 Tax=Rhodovulum sp. BSW8 TaxID=2259645 RepID=UPI000DE22F29|nr:hypothetical protein [Rhodovulum sp. BSW8]RBO52897.1 hypothetical protein DSD19_12035 [Rhodovulum sp. BSW8]
MLILGGSHAKGRFNALVLNPDLHGGIGLARFGTSAKIPADQMEALLAAPSLAAGKTVVLTTGSAEYKPIEGMPVFDWYLRRNRTTVDPEALGRLAWSCRKPQISAINDRIAAIGRTEGVAVVDKIGPICDAPRQSCAAMTDDGYKTFYDYGHSTLEGAACFGRRLHALGGLPF